MIAELTESFFITLERTPGLDSRIIVNPVDGEIEITDNDGLWDFYNIPFSLEIISLTVGCTVIEY